MKFILKCKATGKVMVIECNSFDDEAAARAHVLSVMPGWELAERPKEPAKPAKGAK